MVLNPIFKSTSAASVLLLIGTIWGAYTNHYNQIILMGKRVRSPAELKQTFVQFLNNFPLCPIGL